MPSKVIHIIGNGDKAPLYKLRKREGTVLLCNMPPFEIAREEVYATCMVDFKMMAALTEGSLNLDMYPWVLGTRPRIWMNDPKRSMFYLKYAQNIKEFYTNVPPYAKNATNFNCGHMATHYAAKRLKGTEIHLYGFDSVLDFNMRSITDLYLSSDRGNMNNYRLMNNWRPIWAHMFRDDCKDQEFIFHHTHDELKIPKTDNVRVEVYDPKEEKRKAKEAKARQSKLIPEIPKEQLAQMNRKQRRAYEAQLRKGILG